MAKKIKKRIIFWETPKNLELLFVKHQFEIDPDDCITYLHYTNIIRMNFSLYNNILNGSATKCMYRKRYFIEKGANLFPLNHSLATS